MRNTHSHDADLDAAGSGIRSGVPQTSRTVLGLRSDISKTEASPVGWRSIADGDTDGRATDATLGL